MPQAMGSSLFETPPMQLLTLHSGEEKIDFLSVFHEKAGLCQRRTQVLPIFFATLVGDQREARDRLSLQCFFLLRRVLEKPFHA